MRLSTFCGHEGPLPTLYAHPDMPIRGHMSHLPPAPTPAGPVPDRHGPVLWTVGTSWRNYLVGGTNRVPSFASLPSCRLMSFPTASIRLMLLGLNCGSYGLRAGPPATSSTASNL